MEITTDAAQFRRALRPGDVLVYDTTSFEGGLVQWGDRVPVNHASLVLDADDLVEANRWDDEPCRAVRTVPLADRLAAAGVRTVTALRHGRVRSGELDAQAVTARARAYLDGPRAFAYLEVVALAPAALRRSYADGVDRSRALARAALLLLDLAAEAASRTIDSGARALSCSEFVFRCFDESGDDRLRLEVEDPLFTASEVLPTWLSHQVSEEIDALHEAVRAHNLSTDAALGSLSTDEDADRVTPGDLWRSPTLEPVAVLHRPPERRRPPSAEPRA